MRCMARRSGYCKRFVLSTQPPGLVLPGSGPTVPVLTAPQNLLFYGHGSCAFTESPLCIDKGEVGKIDEAHLPASDKLTRNVRHFLGYHLIKQFDVLNFLEDTGKLRAQYTMCSLLLHPAEILLS